jgi:uncharacterized protein YcbK (DUF882 family)
VKIHEQIWALFPLGEKKIWNIKQNRRNVYKEFINITCGYKSLNITSVEEEMQSGVQNRSYKTQETGCKR